jgi:hypothetical protein
VRRARIQSNSFAREAYVRAFEAVGDGLKRSEDGRDHDLAMVRVNDCGLQSERGRNRIVKRFIHLPISSDYRLSHQFT